MMTRPLPKCRTAGLAPPWSQASVPPSLCRSNVLRHIYVDGARMVSAQDVAGRKSDTGTDEQKQAAQMIQRNYRGYRERRQLAGMGLDASARWAEVGDVRITSEDMWLMVPGYTRRLAPHHDTSCAPTKYLKRSGVMRRDPSHVRKKRHCATTSPHPKHANERIP